MNSNGVTRTAAERKHRSPSSIASSAGMQAGDLGTQYSRATVAPQGHFNTVAGMQQSGRNQPIWRRRAITDKGRFLERGGAPNRRFPHPGFLPFQQVLGTDSACGGASGRPEQGLLPPSAPSDPPLFHVCPRSRSSPVVRPYSPAAPTPTFHSAPGKLRPRRRFGTFA